MIKETKILTDEEVLASEPRDLSDADFERYYALIEIKYADVRKVDHKVGSGGIPIALTEEEIEEFNKKEEGYDEIVLQNAKNSLIYQRQKYLEKTDPDFYKAMDEGTVDDYPEKEARSKARTEKKKIKAATSLKELEKFSMNFEV